MKQSKQGAYFVQGGKLPSIPAQCCRKARNGKDEKPTPSPRHPTAPPLATRHMIHPHPTQPGTCGSLRGDGLTGNPPNEDRETGRHSTAGNRKPAQTPRTRENPAPKPFQFANQLPKLLVIPRLTVYNSIIKPDTKGSTINDQPISHTPAGSSSQGSRD